MKCVVSHLNKKCLKTIDLEKYANLFVKLHSSIHCLFLAPSLGMGLLKYNIFYESGGAQALLKVHHNEYGMRSSHLSPIRSSTFAVTKVHTRKKIMSATFSKKNNQQKVHKNLKKKSTKNRFNIFYCKTYLPKLFVFIMIKKIK